MLRHVNLPVLLTKILINSWIASYSKAALEKYVKVSWTPREYRARLIRDLYRRDSKNIGYGGRICVGNLRERTHSMHLSSRKIPILSKILLDYTFPTISPRDFQTSAKAKCLLTGCSFITPTAAAVARISMLPSLCQPTTDRNAVDPVCWGSTSLACLE